MGKSKDASHENRAKSTDRHTAKIAHLRESGIALFPSGYVVKHTIGDILKAIETAPEELTEQGPQFIVAGRMMAINRFGKSTFIRFRDRTGQLQAYIRKDKIGDETYSLFKQLDVGDVVGLRGTIFKTRTGEWTLLTAELTLLSKATRPLPEKYHGLRDPEKRYRKRYLDMIMNAEVREIFIKRSRIIQSVRQFFLEHAFLEVETPMMQPIPGGAEATPFVTHHKALDMALYLRIAPELYLKRLVVGGFERVFEINRNFRNEGISTQHNPEFTMLEFYQTYATFADLMVLTRKLFVRVAREVLGNATISYQGHTIDLEASWRQITLADALHEIGGVDKHLLNDKQKLLTFAETKGIALDKTRRMGKIITKLFDLLVEPKLIQPTFITGYPVEVSPLSRRSETEPDLTERFELFIAGREIANGFSELNDPEDQLDRFQQQAEDRAAGDDEAHFMDLDYIEALEYGMPPTAGEGIGIDRMTMLFTDAASIREVILFPHMRPVTR